MIYFSHGDKGGVGKSTLSALVLGAALQDGRKVALIEGDQKTPDVGLRFSDAGVQKIGALGLNRAGDAMTAFLALGNWIEAETTADDVVVINLPGGAGDTLDATAASFCETLSELGHEVVVSYLVAPSRIAADNLAESLKSGLVASATRSVVGFPLFMDQRSSFAWLKHPARSNFIQKFGDESEFIFATLDPDDLRSRVFNLQKAFSVLAKTPSPGLSLFERRVVSDWINANSPLVNAILAQKNTKTFEKVAQIKGQK